MVYVLLPGRVTKGSDRVTTGNNYILLSHKATRKNFECFHHKEMKNVEETDGFTLI
jgi:hypothetical protein